MVAHPDKGSGSARKRRLPTAARTAVPVGRARAKAATAAPAPGPVGAPPSPRAWPVRGSIEDRSIGGPGSNAATDAERARLDAAAAAARWSLVTAKDLMRHDVVTVSKTTPLAELVRVLATHRISGAPVIDADGSIVGVVSMRDLIDHDSERSESPPARAGGWFAAPFEHVLECEEDSAACVDVPGDSTETVADIMTADVISVPADAGIREIARVMTRRGVHRVLVEREGAPGVYVGIVGTYQILDMLAE